jgi:alpha-N-acetylglucosaminidase
LLGRLREGFMAIRTMLGAIVAAIALTSAASIHQVDQALPAASIHQADQALPARDLIARFVPASALQNITVRQTNSPLADETDYFTVAASDGKVVIEGSSGVAIASGFYFYLTYYCQCEVSWGTGVNGTNETWGVDQLRLPSTFPSTNGQIEKKMPLKYRYALNVVTYGYSTPFWNEARWMREVDWMALHGEWKCSNWPRFVQFLTLVCRTQG